MFEIDVERVHEFAAVEKAANRNLNPGHPVLKLENLDRVRPDALIGFEHADHVRAVLLHADKQQALDVLRLA